MFQIFWFYLVIVQTGCGNPIKLVNRLVRQFARAFNTLLSMTFHVVAPSCGVFGSIIIGVDICIGADQLQEQILLFLSRFCC